MSRLNVYLSSPYLKLKETRASFLDAMASRKNLYEVTAMESYTAADRDVVYKCLQDVEKCDIYVLVLGDEYGTIAVDKNRVDTGKSYTHWEYEKANERKYRGDEIERLILLKTMPADQENQLDPKLVAWRKEIGKLGILLKYYNDESEIPQKIIDSLDYYALTKIEDAKKKDPNYDEVFLCDRSEICDEFFVAVSKDPVQFFLLTGHEKDMPEYFVRRKQIEYINKSKTWQNIDIRPHIPDTVKDFLIAEKYIKGQIVDQLNWGKFNTPDDVTVESLIDYMTIKNLDCLSVSWMIESAIWKNDNLKKLIVEFYEKYDPINKKLTTDKRIMFFGMLTYVEKSKISEKKFYTLINTIKWKNNLPKLRKLNTTDISEWVRRTQIKYLNTEINQLISENLNEINQRDMYFAEVEEGLKRMINKRKN